LKDIIEQKGGALAGGFAVKMPYNYVIPVFKLKGFLSSFTLRETPPEKQREMFEAWGKRLKFISEYIAAGKAGFIETSSEWIERLVDRLNLRETLQKSSWLKIAGFRGHTDLPFLESIQLMDHGFKADENCSGCGTCEKICPVGDIKMEGGRPVWQHRCTQCFACLQWCPNEAIQFRENTYGRKRYHHPDVELSDILKQATNKITK
jgi:ferredoxin